MYVLCSRDVIYIFTSGQIFDNFDRFQTIILKWTSVFRQASWTHPFSNILPYKFYVFQCERILVRFYKTVLYLKCWIHDSF